MKKLFYILAVATLAAGVVACQKVKEEDAFSKAPVAPELYAHGDILITNNTLEEDVIFSWSSYRFLPENLDYTLYATYGDNDPVALYVTKEQYYSTTKKDFRDLLFQKVSGLPENDVFTLSFYVSVVNSDKEYRSPEVVLSVYGNGDAVAPALDDVMEDTVLDVTDPEGKVEVLSWEPARLVYGEAVTYDVFLSLKPAAVAATAIRPQAEETKKVKLTEDPISETSFSTTVDELNEAIIAAGGAEGAANDVLFEVVAYCASMPNGVPSAMAEAEVTTYLATFPDQLSISGNLKGASVIKHSKAVKGLFQGVVDLTTEDGSNAKFIFTSDIAEFGGKVDEAEKPSGDYAVYVGTVGEEDEITVPSGVYYIEMSMKFRFIRMVPLHTLSLIGSAVGDYGWGEDVDLTFDSAKQVFMATTVFKPGEFKMRFNHNWDWSLGQVKGRDDYTLDGGNIETDKEGEYRIEISVASVPFIIKFVNTSFPEKLYVPGSHNGWSFSKTILNGNGEGKYEGFTKIGGQWGVKLTDKEGWADDGAQVWGQEKDTDVSLNDKFWTTYSLIQDGGNIAQTGLDGDEGRYCYVIVDLDALTVSMAPVTVFSLIGGFDGWKSDFDMAYDSEKDVWTISNLKVDGKNTEFKFRTNHDWDKDGEYTNPNLGGDLDDLKEHGSNCVIAEKGVYTVTLSVATTPFKAELVKTGESDAPDWDDAITVAGDYSGHNWSADNDMHLNHKGNGVFKGAVTMYNPTWGFKFVHQGSWYGQTAAEGLSFTLAAGDSGQNMKVDNGTYVWAVNLADGTAVAEAVTKVGVIGDFEGSGWNNDVEMTFNTDALTYSAQVTLAAGNQFKIRFNGAWTHSLGGDPAALTYDGANITVTEAGTYTLVLDMKTGPYATLSMTK